MLVNLPLENEDQCNPGRKHPQHGLHGCSNTERSGNTRALLRVLDIEAEGRCQEHTPNIDAPDDPMEPAETLTKAIGKLYWAEQKRACSGNSMRQQPPLKGLVVRPHRIFRINQETFIVKDNVGQHQADGSKEQIFWT